MLTIPYNLFLRCFRYRSSTNMSPVDPVRAIKMSFTEYNPLRHIQKSDVIIMHCIMGSKMDWHEFGEDLAKKTMRRIYCADARNHCNSAFTKDHSIQLLAEDIAEFRNYQSLGKVTLIGHGMGGRAVMFFALKYPSVVDGVIVVDISPVTIPMDYTNMDLIFKIMKGVEIPNKHSLDDARDMMQNVFAKVVIVEQNAKCLANNLQKNSRGEFYWSMNIDVLNKNLDKFSEFINQLGSKVTPFKGPTMFICGNRSNFVDNDSIATIKILFPRSELHWLDASHLVRMDQPEQFLNLVVHFLNK